MIRNAQAGETAVLTDGTTVTITKVYRAPDGRVTILTTLDKDWRTAWELKRLDTVKEQSS